MARVVLPLAEARSPVGAARLDTPVRRRRRTADRSAAACRIFLRVACTTPACRAAFRTPGVGAAVPVEHRPRVAAFEQQLVGERRRPLDVADGVMRLLRIAELADPRVLPGGEVLALALPPPLTRTTASLCFVRRLPRQPQRRTAHVGVEVRVDDLAVAARRSAPARRRLISSDD